MNLSKAFFNGPHFGRPTSVVATPCDLVLHDIIHVTHMYSTTTSSKTKLTTILLRFCESSLNRSFTVKIPVKMVTFDASE